MKKLVDYYQKLVDDNHKRKAKCLHNAKTSSTLVSDLNAIKQKLLEHESKLNKEKLEFILKTLDGNEAKWKNIKTECQILLEKTKILGEELKDRIVGDQMIEFKPNKSFVQIESICGRLYECSPIDSTIIRNYKMKNDLVKLCKLSGKEFKLIYRASRDGFEAKRFHAKCDNQSGTLTVIKTRNEFVFGAYTAVTWDCNRQTYYDSSVKSNYKTDSSAYIFSLINAIQQPQLIPIKANERHCSIRSDKYFIMCTCAILHRLHRRRTKMQTH